ncbi:MAG: cytochrome b [Rhodospirillales bacterium]|nr:cytochrome b [Rhodospirillales bacterium]MCB9979846.1 cytochrome b [Rhodospirillales bacterium]
MDAGVKRYHSFTIILHWIMALAFFLMLGSGVAMENFDLDKSLKFQLFQWHKSGGVLLLMAFFLRLAVRFATRIPPLPELIPALERKASKAGHYALYAVMFLLPFSGWAVVSSSSYGIPTVVFNLFEWPHIPGLQGNKDVHEFAEEGHTVLAIIFALLIFGHIAAVVKHAVVEKENLLKRMWWSK